MFKKSTSNNIWFALIALCYFTSLPVFAATIYVDGDASGAKNGSNWADAYNYLQDALDAAVSGDEVWVAAGVYKPDEGVGVTPGNREATFSMINGVAIYGGFDGTETALAQRDVQNNETILSGDLSGNDAPDFANNDENSYHVVTGSNTDSNAILDGFTITAGNADDSYPHNAGGGMFNISFCSPTVSGCTFIANSADLAGGGMVSDANSSPTLTDCTFIGNSASYGGGMHSDAESKSILTNCTFSGNSATYGGGLSNYAGSPNLVNCTFTGNSANYGGGMYNWEASLPTVTNCTLSGNSAGYGGGIYNSGSSPTVTGCTFSGNSAANEGGGMYNYESSSPTVTNCTFTGNSADDYGGGMYNQDSSPTVTGCTFTGNWAYLGGGGEATPPNIRWVGPFVTTYQYFGASLVGFVSNLEFGNEGEPGTIELSISIGSPYNIFKTESFYVEGGTHYQLLIEGAFYGLWPLPDFWIYNMEFIVDSPSAVDPFQGSFNGPTCDLVLITNIELLGPWNPGGGMYNKDSAPTITNCIMYQDTAGTSSDEISNSGSTPTISYSDIQGCGASGAGWDTSFGTDGGGNIDANPLFVDDDNADPNIRDYHLLGGSPCIDAADGDVAPGTDILGNGRYDDPDTDNTGTGSPDYVDIGAYEFQGETSLAVGRHIFYNDSSFDGDDPSANADDDSAIATDKSALLPGGTATFANYTSYHRGINGIMVDINHLADPNSLSASNFEFYVGNTDDPSNWSVGPAPSSVTVRQGAGVGGSDRVTLIWDNWAIMKQWLQVTVKADTVTGLASPDVFYFGNAVGESGNSPMNAYVDGIDFAGPLNNPRNFLNRAPVDFKYDYNRDSLVDGIDMGVVLNNNTNFITALKLLDLSVSTSALMTSAATANCGDENHPYPVGDVTEDCYVNLDDFNLLAHYWRRSNCTSPDDCEGSDFEPDGDVDLADLAVIAEHWLECTNPYPPCNYLP